jgi:hypothetical protein
LVLHPLDLAGVATALGIVDTLDLSPYTAPGLVWAGAMMRPIYLVLLAVFLSGGTAAAEDAPLIIGGGSTAVVVPFEDMGRAGLFVPVMIDGHGPYRFILSLASQTFVTGDVAGKFGLPIKENVWLSTGYASSGAKIVQAKLTLAGTEVPADQFYTWADRLDSDGLRYIPEFGGVLGYELLQDYSMAIDFDHKTLTLQPSFAPPPSATVVDAMAAGATGPLGFVQRPAIPVTIDGVETHLSLSLRSSATIDIDQTSPAAKSLLQRARKTVAFKVDGGADEDAQQYALFRAGTVRIGGISTSDVIVRTALTPRSRREWGPTNKLEMDGGIALGFLRRFNLTIDRYGARVALAPRNPSELTCVSMPPYYDAGYGVQPLEDGTERIDSVVPGSPAERAGLAVGDIIVARDGVSPAMRLPQPGKPPCPAYGAGPVHLTLKARTKTRELTLVPEPLLP